MQNETRNDKFLLNCRNYCPALNDQYNIFDEIIECLEQKQFKQYSVTTEKNGVADVNSNYFGTKWNSHFLLRQMIHILSSFQWRNRKTRKLFGQNQRELSYNYT